MPARPTAFDNYSPPSLPIALQQLDREIAFFHATTDGRIIDEARRLERESAGRHDEREADVLGGGGLTRGSGAM